MPVATYDQLRQVGRPLTEAQRSRRVRLAKSLEAKDLFLSHSSRDVQHLEAAIVLLSKHGADVYVDVQDAGIRGLTDAAIASRLREAIAKCKRLVVLMTEQTRSSRWIPWELGVADGRRGREQAALLPLRPNAAAPSGWATEGYFEIYPRIEPRKAANGEPFWAVVDPADGKHWRLERWLTL